MSTEMEPQANPKLSVLVVTYKSLPFIEACFDSLFEHMNPRLSVEVLVVDNCDDGTLDLIRQRYPEVRIIENCENLGFAKGNNVLAEAANGEYLLLLNPDTIIHDDAIGELVAFADQNPHGAAWGGVTLLSDGSVDPSCTQTATTATATLLKVLGLSRFTDRGPDRLSDFAAPVPVLCGAFMLVRREDWMRVGGFDESFVMYAEELDLCHRLSTQERPCLMTSRATITHIGGGGDMLSSPRIMQLIRGQMQFSLKHHSPLRILFDRLCVLTHATMRCCFSVLLLPRDGIGLCVRRMRAFAPVCMRPWAWWNGWSRHSL